MIKNANILQINRDGGADAGGEPIIDAGADLTALPGGAPRCFVDAVTSQQLWLLGATIKNASRKAMIFKVDLVAAGEDAPDIGDQLVLQVDGEDAATMEAVLVNDLNLNSLSHFEVFCKKV